MMRLTATASPVNQVNIMVFIDSGEWAEASGDISEFLEIVKLYGPDLKNYFSTFKKCTDKLS